MQEIIARLVEGRDLDEDTAGRAMTAIMEGRATEAQVAAFLVGLRLKGETVAEITGCARVMRAKACRLDVDRSSPALDRTGIRFDRATIVDTCGTGGDGTGTFNISTASAFVAAAGGCLVAKHGNRSVSSACGSAEVVGELGVNIELAPPQVKRCIEEVGIGFLYAPLYHAAMKYAAPVRAQLGVRTVFNLLGPLTNPAGAEVQVLGVCAPALTARLAGVLRNLGSRGALVVHGADSGDEISISGPTAVTRLGPDGRLSSFTLEPADAGLPVAAPAAVAGGDARRNAAVIRAVLAGDRGAPRDVVLMNAGAVFWAAGRAGSFREGVAMAAEAIDSGRARGRLAALVSLSRRL